MGWLLYRARRPVSLQQRKVCRRSHLLHLPPYRRDPLHSYATSNAGPSECPWYYQVHNHSVRESS